MRPFNEYLNIVNNAIANVDLSQKPENLFAPIAYTMSLGGKRLRPVLLLMTCEACGGLCDNAINQAIGLEFFHNFTLLHDDVMDKADVRRGKPTVHKKWDENTAILSGDTMLTIASQLMAKAPMEKLPAVIEVFNRAAIEIYQGQQYDMDFESRNDVSVDEYIEMIRLKTSILFGEACRLGAIMAGVESRKQDALYAFAEALGLAFQLQDDLLDTYGDPSTFGKEIGGDIRNAKKTFMLISAYANANNAEKTRLDELLAISDPARDTEKIEGVKAIYDSLSIPRLCEEKINLYIETALKWLEKANLEPNAKESFTGFVNMLVNRKK